MKNSKLVEEAKLNPGRIYHRPHDVLRDRRLDDAARLEILRAWETRLSPAEQSEDDATANERNELRQARGEVEQRLSACRAAE